MKSRFYKPYGEKFIHSEIQQPLKVGISGIITQLLVPFRRYFNGVTALLICIVHAAHTADI